MQTDQVRQNGISGSAACKSLHEYARFICAATRRKGCSGTRLKGLVAFAGGASANDSTMIRPAKKQKTTPADRAALLVQRQLAEVGTEADPDLDVAGKQMTMYAVLLPETSVTIGRYGCSHHFHKG